MSFKHLIVFCFYRFGLCRILLRCYGRSNRPLPKRLRPTQSERGATYRPFEFQTPNKEIVGFDIDLMKEIAKGSGALRWNLSIRFSV